MKRPATLVLFALLLALAAALPTLAAAPTPINETARATGYVLVETTGGPPANAAGRVEHIFHNWYRLYLPPGQGINAALSSAAAQPGVVGVYADTLVYAHAEPAAAPAALVPGDPRYGDQWHMPQVQAEAAWDVVDGTGAVVAILDTGVSLAGSDGFCLPLHSEYNAITGSSLPGAATDGYAHGTHVAGTAAGCTGNGVGVTGLAYGAQIMAVKVLSDSGSGFDSDIAEGIVWAADHGAGVINMSLGASCSSEWPACSSAIVNQAIEYAAAADVVIVASAGNSQKSIVGRPANHPEIIAISATGPSRGRAFYSNWGSAIDLAAPGGDKSQSLNDGVLQETFIKATGVWNYYYYQGTSMAAPHVTGAVALLRSCAPEATRDEIRAALQNGAEDLGTPGYDTTFGHGFLQIHDALAILASQFGRDVTDHCAFTGQTPCVTLATAAAVEGNVTVEPDPDCDAGGTPGYSLGTPLTLSATADTGYWFAGWSGGATGAANPLNKTIYRDLSVTASFQPCLVVAATADGPGTVGVSPPPNCGGAGYNGGTVMTLTPTPDPGNYFDQWTGDATGTSRPLTLTLNDDLTVNAVFAACLSVTTHADGPGAVGVAPAPNCLGGAGYNGRTALTFTATPNPGFVFTGWSGGVSGAANPLAHTLLATLDVTASFAPPPRPAISLLANGKAGGLAYGDEDVIERAGASWLRLFDGSAHALPGDVDGLAVLPDGTLLLSTDAPVNGLPGIAPDTLDDSDVARYDPATGQYSWYFDGSDVGLTTNAEDIDALALLSDGRLLFSTIGAATGSGPPAADEDVLAFTGTLGSSTTTGSWAFYIEGSDLSTALADVDGVAVYGDAAYLTATAKFSLSGQVIAVGDIFVCRGVTPGTTTRCTSLGRFWQGTANGLGAKANIDALEMLEP